MNDVNTMLADVKSEACPFCNWKQTDYWYSYLSKSDEQSYPIYKCKSCKSVFVYPMPSEEALAIFYKSSNNSIVGKIKGEHDSENYYQFIQEEVNYPNDVIDADRIAHNARKLCSSSGLALDIGSGYGFFSSALLKSGFEVEALELNHISRGIFKEMNGFAPMEKSFDLDFAKANTSRYDLVLLSQVLEHLTMNTNPIKNIHMILKPGGVCVVAVPHFRSFVSILQGKEDMFITPPEHLNLFMTNGLARSFA